MITNSNIKIKDKDGIANVELNGVTLSNVLSYNVERSVDEITKVKLELGFDPSKVDFELEEGQDLEEKPKFKVGDKVKVNTSACGWAPKGAVGVIIRIDEDVDSSDELDIRVKFGSDNSKWVDSSHFDLIPNFKVGDNVKIVGDSNDATRARSTYGTYGTIVFDDIHDKKLPFEVSFPEGGSYWLHPQDLELISEFKVGDTVIVTDDTNYIVTKTGSHGVVTEVFENRVEVDFEYVSGSSRWSTGCFPIRKQDLKLKVD